jgi:hypothetical protein
VHLLIGGPVRIPPLGLRASTLRLDGGEAQVEVAVEVANTGPDPRAVTVDVALERLDGTAVGAASANATLDAGQSTVVRQRVPVPDAQLWSPDEPALHRVRAVLRSGAPGPSGASGPDVLDEADDTFGIRTVAADAAGGLRINGVPLKLRGACVHHDSGVIGATTLDAAEDRRVRILKESGYNAIRSAHNPAACALLRACDRHGVLVMDELTDAWYRPKTAFDYSADFEDWWERDLAAMVAKDANHPSVILYSIGNEIAETSQPRGIELGRRMAARVRELDPHRLVTNAVNGLLNLISPADKPAKAGAAERPAFGDNLVGILNFAMGILEKVMPYLLRLPAADKRTRDAYAPLDVAGYNYMPGRYRIDGRRHPERVIVGSETNPPFLAHDWRVIESLPYVIGDFAWTGWDYLGEAGIAVKRYDERRQLYLPYPALLAGEPVVDITGHLQTQAHLNRIVWHQTPGPHLAVQPVDRSGHRQTKSVWRSTNSIHSWAWEGREGRRAVVEVYADAPRVDLVLNGVVVGSRPAGYDHGYLATFVVPYAPGTLTAVAYDDDGREIGRDTLTSAGAGLRLRAVPEAETLTADGMDLLYIPIELTDDDGVLRPLADRPVTVEVAGAGTLLGFGSAEPITPEAFAATVHTTYQGRALAVVRAGLEPGVVTLTATASGCDPVTIRVSVVAPPAVQGG